MIFLKTQVGYGIFLWRRFARWNFSEPQDFGVNENLSNHHLFQGVIPQTKACGKPVRMLKTVCDLTGGQFLEGESPSNKTVYQLYQKQETPG